jgi:hypothetical protein
LENISFYNLKNEKYSLQGDFDLKNRRKYLNLLKTERLIIMNTTDECTLISAYDVGMCAALDAPIRVDGNLVGVVCVEQYNCEKHVGERFWTIE